MLKSVYGHPKGSGYATGKENKSFVLIIHQVNNHGVSRRLVIETDVKHFKSGALQTITNITRSMVN